MGLFFYSLSGAPVARSTRSRPKAAPRRASRGIGPADVRRAALALPDVEEYRCYGTPGFRVRGKLFARLHEDGQSLVLRVLPVDRDLLLQAAPDLFYITEHYRNYPWLLLRMPAATTPILRERLAEAWRAAAPRRLLAAFDAGTT
jgi:hypothetical protein